MARLQAKPVTANEPMTAAQTATLKNLANAAYELDAFKPNLTRAEVKKRIITLTAKLKLLDEPPHTLWGTQISAPTVTTGTGKNDQP